MDVLDRMNNDYKNSTTLEDSSMDHCDNVTMRLNARGIYEASTRRRAKGASRFFAIFMLVQLSIIIFPVALSHGISLQALFLCIVALCIYVPPIWMTTKEPENILTCHFVAAAQVFAFVFVAIIFNIPEGIRSYIFYGAFIFMFYRDAAIMLQTIALVFALQCEGFITPPGFYFIAVLVIAAIVKSNDEILMVCRETAKLEIASDKLKTKLEDTLTECGSLKSSCRLRSQFMSNMSHELRIPLNAVIGYNELVIDSIDSAYTPEIQGQIEHDARKASVSAHHMLDIINNILDVSKIEFGNIDVTVEEFNIVPVICDVVDVMEDIIVRKRNKFEYSISENVTNMCSDQTRLRQSLCSVLSNAAKFTTDGIICLDIDMINVDSFGKPTDASNAYLRFRVSDTGVGMSKGQLMKIFKPFAQANNDENKKIDSTGLGLVIAKNFCDLMGGAINIESEVGKGTTMTIYLPQTSRRSECENND